MAKGNVMNDGMCKCKERKAVAAQKSTLQKGAGGGSSESGSWLDHRLGRDDPKMTSPSTLVIAHAVGRLDGQDFRYPCARGTRIIRWLTCAGVVARNKTRSRFCTGSMQHTAARADFAEQTVRAS